MPTCIFVHTHNFYSNVCRERCQLKKSPFFLERAANIRQRHIFLGFRRHELFKFLEQTPHSLLFD